MIPLVAAGAAGASLLSPIAGAVAALYGVGTSINDFLNRHIDEMQESSNPTIASTGRILAAAKYGFGLGYISSVSIIAVGQFLLGNTFAALSTIATGATLTNPIAMTCAAVGAILYGWKALSDSERQAIMDKLSAGLEIGVQLIRSIIDFVIQTAADLMDSKAMKEFKAYIADKAALFGRSLSDVTHQAIDMFSDISATVMRQAGDAASSVARVAVSTGELVAESASAIGNAAGQVVDQTTDAAKRLVGSAKADEEKSDKS